MGSGHRLLYHSPAVYMVQRYDVLIPYPLLQFERVSVLIVSKGRCELAGSMSLQISDR